MVAQLVKNLAIQETPVQFLGQEDSPGEGIGYPLQYSWASRVAQLVKNPPAMRETCVQSLGWEDPLEKGKATHSAFHGLFSRWGHKESDTTECLSHSLFQSVCLLSPFLALLHWHKLSALR